MFDGAVTVTVKLLLNIHPNTLTQAHTDPRAEQVTNEARKKQRRRMMPKYMEHFETCYILAASTYVKTEDVLTTVRRKLRKRDAG